ncbi:MULTISPECIES: hypothetical protein [Enterobacteriaceae]|uniref:hypothetical protein n=1 Tax=Enterobacteriaceae TaxID=543 RepID=UPI0011ED9812|nr:hypothetical protein [Citrobacter braakii]
MRQLSIALIALFFGFTAIAADSTNSVNTAAPTQPPLVFGPGPVINPENSQYMENKTAQEKAQQEPAPQPPNRHPRLHHGLIPPSQNQ